MAKIIFICLFLAVAIGCNDDGGMGEPDCISNEELIDSECLAEDLYQACNRYFCEELLADSSEAATIPPDSYFGFECIPLDCETIFCGLATYNELRIMDDDEFPGIFGTFIPDVLPPQPIQFGPCEFE